MIVASKHLGRRGEKTIGQNGPEPAGCFEAMHGERVGISREGAMNMVAEDGTSARIGGLSCSGTT